MKACSLFSGCGGDTLGMEQAGLSVDFFSELKPNFQKSHFKNFKKSKMIGDDITKIPDEKFLELRGTIKVMFGGFPCQSFSHGGKKDPNDPRGQLYLQFVRAARLVEPEYIIGENVKGLISRVTPQGENFLEVILKAFSDIGYQCHFRVFKADDFGVPQTRERLIIVGKRGQWTPQWPLAIPGKPSLKNILKFDMNGALEVPNELFDEAGVPEDCVITGTGEPIGNPHPYLIDRANVRGVVYKDKTYSTYSFSFGKRISPVHCEIVNPKAKSKTIICTYDHQPRLFVAQRVGEKRYLRCLTPNELKEIQGFPRDYQLEGSLKEQIVQLGNAVPPPIVREVCKVLLNSN
jgi:DNA (cytosine-5)-methyltransferase 1